MLARSKPRPRAKPQAGDPLARCLLGLIPLLRTGPSPPDRGMTEPNERSATDGSHPSGKRSPEDPTRLGFLARASELLLASRTDWATLEQLARLAVPALADWCAIDLLGDDGRLRRVAVVHQDPSKVAIASELERRFPPDETAGYGVPQVVRTGSSELYAEIGERQLLAT